MRSENWKVLVKKTHRISHKVAQRRRRRTCHSSWYYFDVPLWRSGGIHSAAWQTSGRRKCGLLRCLTPGRVSVVSVRQWQRPQSPVCWILPLTSADSTARDTCLSCPCTEFVAALHSPVEHQSKACWHSARELHRYATSKHRYLRNNNTSSITSINIIITWNVSVRWLPYDLTRFGKFGQR